MKLRPPYPPGVYLKPGELHIARRPALIETVLGSCVAVALYCPGKRCGALCHAMLPTGDGDDHKYVDSAINYMVRVIQQHGMVVTNVVAKLFGGSDMFDASGAAGMERFAVGAENIKMARAVLQQHHIDIKRSDVGGIYGRKLLFFSDTGQVFVKKLDRKAVDRNLLLFPTGVNRDG